MNKIIQVGNLIELSKFDNPQRGRIYSAKGIAPCVNTVGGGNLEIIEYEGDTEIREERSSDALAETRRSERKRSDGNYRQTLEIVGGRIKYPHIGRKGQLFN